MSVDVSTTKTMSGENAVRRSLLSLTIGRMSVRIALGIYLLMWLLTALIGIPSVDRRFDEDLAMGSVGFGGPHNVPMPVKRVAFFDVSDLDPSTLLRNAPDTPWRCRSNGFAVAPFVIIDEVAWQDHILSGFSGRRLVFWFFGFIRWVAIKQYWVS